jgi:hypothetical protein
MGSEYQPEDTQARLDAWSSEEESVDWVGEELRDMKSQLVQERSFRKVYTAVGILAFLYGLFYGVYLSK